MLVVATRGFKKSVGEDLIVMSGDVYHKYHNVAIAQSNSVIINHLILKQSEIERLRALMIAIYFPSTREIAPLKVT